MKDFSINLPSWAINLGYKLEGGRGTYDELFLYKRGYVVKKWGWLDNIPNIFEVEEVIKGYEAKD